MASSQEKLLPLLIADLWQRIPLAPLGPGTPDRAMRDQLSALDDVAFGGQISDRSMAASCRAGLWLAFNYLDESHAISQELSSAEGSYWHAIMHRREPDPSNAAYWFRRVGDHPLFESLAMEARALGLPLHSERWNPFHLIDLCEQHRGKGSEQETLLRHVQRKEGELLFAWCFRGATGKELAIPGS